MRYLYFTYDKIAKPALNLVINTLSYIDLRILEASPDSKVPSTPASTWKVSFKLSDAHHLPLLKYPVTKRRVFMY